MLGAPRLESKFMEYDKAFELNKFFNDINGGIEMCLCNFARCLVMHGTQGILQNLEEEIARIQEPNARADLYEVSRGLKKLDRTAIEKAVAEAEEHFQRMNPLQDEFQLCNEKLEELNRQWHAAAQSVDLQLKAWGKWAYEIKFGGNKGRGPFGNYNLGIRESANFTCVSSVFDSPKKFEANLKYFEDVVDTIRASIAVGYRSANHPEALDPREFDQAVEALGKLLKSHKILSLRKEEISQKVLPAEANYFSKQRVLVAQLELMSDTAQRALFRLYRFELEKQIAA